MAPRGTGAISTVTHSHTTPWQRLSSRCAGLAVKSSWKPVSQAKKKRMTARGIWIRGGDDFFGLGSESIQGASSGGATEAWQSADWKALITSRSRGPVRQRTPDGGEFLARYRSSWELRSGISTLWSEHRSEDAHLPLRTRDSRRLGDHFLLTDLPPFR